MTTAPSTRTLGLPSCDSPARKLSAFTAVSARVSRRKWQKIVARFVVKNLAPMCFSHSEREPTFASFESLFIRSWGGPHGG